MATLTPSVHELLARCGTRVYVDGLVAGADVVLTINGASQPAQTAGADGSLWFAVPPLQGGAAVQAKQDAGAGFTPLSPAVIVEDVLLPPNAPPTLPDAVGMCSQCVYVQGLVPECRVELAVGNQAVGQSIADLDGNVCIDVDLSSQHDDAGNVLRARMRVCGQLGPEANSLLVPESALPKPVVGAPLFGCQRSVPLSNLHPGAGVRLQSDTRPVGSPNPILTDLGSFCSCWDAVNDWIGSQLVTGQPIRAQQFFSGKGACLAQGPWSDWQPVVQPDERIKPKVLEALIEGDQVIRVDNQIAGASLMVRIQPAAGQPEDEFGPRPAGRPEIALNAALAAGNVVSVVQTLCGVSMESDPATVLPKPPVVYAPVVLPPLYDCGAVVQVSNLQPGSVVRVYQDGIPIGLGWAGTASSVAVSVSPSLVAGGKVTARQWVGGVDGPESAPSVPVLRLVEPARPRILRPVAVSDTLIWVSRVPPGARVTIRAGGRPIGSAISAEPIVRVPVAPVMGAIDAVLRLCQQTATSDPVQPIPDPCGDGRFPETGEEFKSYPAWNVPATADGDAFNTTIEGQLYFPAQGGDIHPNVRNLPLVVIAHGLWEPNVMSYTGYDYLAKHLAGWGMLVFSINLDVVNTLTEGNRTHQYSRGEIILHVIDTLLADQNLAGRIDPTRIGLIGHSMGGEGVVAAQFLNQTENRGYNLLGVVSIAPTHWRPELILRQTKYMQLLGSHDQLLLWGGVTGPDDPAMMEGVFSGFRIYDRAWRPKTHSFIYKARHNPFNRVWVADGDKFEGDPNHVSLDPAYHELIAKCLINAFFQDALLGQAEYAGYMEGTILPPSLRAFQIHTQHSMNPRVVVDNYGDADEQVPLADSPLDKSHNRLGQQVQAAPQASADFFDAVDHTTLDHSPHNTKGLRLAWKAPDLVYTTATGGLAPNLPGVFALRIAQFLDDPQHNPLGQPMDLFVTLDDGANQATLRLGAVALVPYPDLNLCPMRTVRLPLDAFQAANPALDMATIQAIRLRLACQATGDLLADDLELGN
jgi:hypothetical protein